jgi:methyl-accepting chemotaxis protein
MRLFQTVKSRIYGAFGAITGLMLVTGAASILLMSNAEHLFAEYRHTARQSLAIDEQLRNVSLMRIDFLNYLLAPSDKWAKDVRNVLSTIETDIAATDVFDGDAGAVETIDEVHALAGEYRAGFDRIVAATKAGGIANDQPEVKSLTTIGPRMYGLLDELSHGAHDTQNELGPRIAQQEALQLTIVAVISGLGLLIGLALAVLTGRWLTGTFTRLTSTMGALSAGKYDTTIEGTETRNELGDMARALETFRINGLNVAEAEKEKQARAKDVVARAEMMARFQSAFDGVIERAMAGDFTARLASDFGDDEINRIAGNLDGMMASVETALGEADRVLGALASADLRDRMVGDYLGAFAKLKTSTNSVGDKLEAITLQLRETSRGLKQATGEILAGANDLSERTTKQAATIEETAAAMEQLATTVSLNADRAREASIGATRMTSIAEASSAVMSQATEAMTRISTSSSKISNIIGLIDDIAFQTNLLALNASVEAARAGEAGKGFAVVAVEVRRLAQNAAQASADVKQLIDQSGEEVRGGTKLVSDVAGRLSEIIDGVKSSAGLMENIAQDSASQASGIGQVNVAVRQMDEMTQHNAALVEEMNASIEQTETQAGQLDGIVETFTLRESRRPALAAVEKAPVRETSPARPVSASVRSTARAYIGGAAAEDWNEF